MKKIFSPLMLLIAFMILCTTLSAQQHANVKGSWIMNVESAIGTGSPSFELKHITDSTIEGTYHGQLGETTVKGTVQGNKIHISFSVSDNVIEYDGTVDGDTMKGKVVLGSLGEGTFTGNRKKS